MPSRPPQLLEIFVPPHCPQSFDPSVVAANAVIVDGYPQARDCRGIPGRKPRAGVAMSRLSSSRALASQRSL
jgi:hypothetical protein